jgi:hypothetical protein
VLVDKLRLSIPTQEHAEIVKPCDDALKLDAVDEKNRDRNLRLADMVQESILQILLVRGHCCRLLFFFPRPCPNCPTARHSNVPTCAQSRRRVHYEMRITDLPEQNARETAA